MDSLAFYPDRIRRRPSYLPGIRLMLGLLSLTKHGPEHLFPNSNESQIAIRKVGLEMFKMLTHIDRASNASPSCGS